MNFNLNRLLDPVITTTYLPIGLCKATKIELWSSVSSQFLLLAGNPPCQSSPLCLPSTRDGLRDGVDRELSFLGGQSDYQLEETQSRSIMTSYLLCFDINNWSIWYIVLLQATNMESESDVEFRWNEKWSKVHLKMACAKCLPFFSVVIWIASYVILISYALNVN